MNKTKRRHLQCKSRCALKKRRRWKEYVKRRNKWRNQSTVKRQRTSIKKNFMSIGLPSYFCESNIEEILKFVNRIFSRVKSQLHLRHIFIEMARVKEIDTVGICILLSLVYKLAGNHISVRGNFPDDNSAKQSFIDSGFLDLMNSNIRSSRLKTIQNILYQLGGDNVVSSRIGRSVKKTVKILTGVEDHFAPAFENMMEICANSVEHANEESKDKNWIISISFKNGTAYFLLVDTGEGILKTLKKKYSEQISDFISNKSDGEILNHVFNGGYKSQTGEINRHLGLPNVLQSFKDGYINDLKVVTNHVIFDFNSNDEIKLYNEFHGTMILWSLTKDNIELWQKEN